jgi:hypothetical protein
MLELWYQALAEPIGLVIETNNPDRYKARLYRAREESGDPALKALSIVQSPTTPNQIWIIKNRNDK